VASLDNLHAEHQFTPTMQRPTVLLNFGERGGGP